jgi:hypothetical protein
MILLSGPYGSRPLPTAIEVGVLMCCILSRVINSDVPISTARFADTYLTRTWKGPTSGFKATKVIYDKRHNTNGFIGILPSTNEVYVVYRGTNSLQNWITAMMFGQFQYPYPRCLGCQVHQSFYEAEQAVINDVLAEVKRLLGLYSSNKVVVTGHNVGAALALLTAVDLKAAGYNVVVYNTGSPRVGNFEFANYAGTQFPDIHRLVHDNDIMPHLPFESMNFHHVRYEYFEDGNSVRRCDSSGEDVSCSNKYRLKETSLDAHWVYLGIPIKCQQVSEDRDL